MTKKVSKKSAKKAAQKPAAKPEAKEPRPAKAPKSAKTVAETAPKVKGGTKPVALSESMGKPFSLVTCKRLVALVEMHNSCASRLSGLKETLKVIRTALDEKGIASNEERTLAVQLVHAVRESDSMKQTLKGVVVDVHRLIIETVGGNLFELAEQSKGEHEDGLDSLYDVSTPGKPKGKHTEKVVAGPADPLSPSTIAGSQTVKDDAGQEVPAIIQGGPVTAGAAALSWWAHLNTPAWNAKLPKTVAKWIESLHEADCRSPSMLLAKMKMWWTNAADRKQAIEALPDHANHDLWSGVREILTAAAEADAEGTYGVRDAIVGLAAANVDAWIDFCDGADAKLNQIRVAHEK